MKFLIKMRTIKKLVNKLISLVFDIKVYKGHLAKNRVKKSYVKNWYSFEISQPIIQPPGQDEESYEGKIHNTEIAIEKIGLLKINPGEIFSFWEILGNPDGSRGFKRGAMLVNNELIFTDGGGLCQISTVIYAAALHFGCKILKRKNHLYDIYGDARYYILGQDATVAYPQPDLVFKNNFNEQIVISSRIEDASIVVTISSPRKFCDVVVESKILKIFPRKITYIHECNTSKLLSDGADGKKVQTKRKVTSPSGKVTCELISNDIYRPLPKV